MGFPIGIGDFGSARAGDHYARIYQLNDASMALASQVDYHNPVSVAFAGQIDKAIQLEKIQHEIGADVQWAMFEAAQTRRQKRREQQARMLENGWLFSALA